jgi:hypothetical protein
MNTTKMLAFVMCLVSLSGVLFFGYIAATARFASFFPAVEYPVLASIMMFCMSAPLAMLPGVAGLGLWFFVIRRREAAIDQEAAALLEREATLQARLKEAVRHLVVQESDVGAAAVDFPSLAQGLDEDQRSRLLGFLGECGIPWAKGAPPPRPLTGSEREPSNWGARAFNLGLFVFAGLSLLWSCLMVFLVGSTSFGRLFEQRLRLFGFPLRPEEMLVNSLGCVAPGLAALIGALVLRRLLRRERQKWDWREALRQRAQDIALDGCLSRGKDLFPQYSRIGRADVVCTLPALDSARRERLIAELWVGEVEASRFRPVG